MVKNKNHEASNYEIMWLNVVKYSRNVVYVVLFTSYVSRFAELQTGVSRILVCWTLSQYHRLCRAEVWTPFEILHSAVLLLWKSEGCASPPCPNFLPSTYINAVPRVFQVNKTVLRRWYVYSVMGAGTAESVVTRLPVGQPGDPSSISGRGKRLFSSRKITDRFWGPPSLIFSG